MKKTLLIFLGVCLGLSFGIAALFHFLGGQYSSAIGMLFASGYMLLPLVSVLITQLICHEKLLSGCGISFKINRWWFVAWIGIVLIVLAAIATSTLMPGVSLTLESDLMQKTVEPLAAQGLPIGPLGVIGITLLSGLFAGATINAAFAFGEEVAWRGFLARVLKPLGFWKKSLLIGAVWGLWHAPIILMGHNYPSHPVAGVFMMIAFCTLLSPVLMFLMERSGSMIVAAIAHGTMNAVAGLALILLSGYNDLLCGMCGLAGFLVILVVDILIAAQPTSASALQKE